MGRGGCPTYWMTPAANPRQTNARRHGRLRCEEVTCGLGEVLDVSASGLRVRGRGDAPLPGGTFETKFTSLWGTLDVSLRVVRVEPFGRDRWEAGCEFSDVPTALRAMLAEIARSAATNETVLARPPA